MPPRTGLSAAALSTFDAAYYAAQYPDGCKEIRPALLDGFGVIHSQGQPGGCAQHRKAHDHPVVVVPVQNAFRCVQMLGAAVHRDGAALAFQHAAAGPQLGFHGGDAVTLLQAQALGVADDGGALTQQAQHHEHRAKVRAVGQVDVHPVQGCLCKGDGVPLTGELCAAPVQEIQNDRVALQGVRGKAGDGL